MQGMASGGMGDVPSGIIGALLDRSLPRMYVAVIRRGGGLTGSALWRSRRKLKHETLLRCGVLLTLM